MRGSIYRRHGGWGYVVDIGRTPDGRRQQATKQGFRSKREAEQALRALLHAIDTDRYVEPTSLCVGEYLLNEWLPAVKPPRLRESTWNSYRAELNNHVIPHLGGTRLQALNAPQLNKLYAHLLTHGRRDGTGGLSPRSVRYIHTILSKALSDANRWGHLRRNPATLADTPPPGADAGTHIRVWSAEELRRFLQSVSDDRLYAAWLLQATTGMRRGEVLGLRWSDLMLDARRLAVRQTLVMVAGAPRLSQPKTRHSRRTIDLDARTVDAIREWGQTQASERQAWTEAWCESGLVFTREDGSPLDPGRWSKVFERHARTAGLPRIRLHDLRHSHATLLLAEGVNPKVASERLGHHSVAFTLDTYAHVIPGMQASAANRVANLVFGSSGEGDVSFS